jgi:endoglycosylceramidase
VEPEPGVYDEAYLDQIENAVRVLEKRGIYSIIDLHQDAWGPTLAARPDEVCPPGREPAFGWDGAPGWATLVPDTTARCIPIGAQRELAPAVVAAFIAFWNDAASPAASASALIRGDAAPRGAPLRPARRRGRYDLMNSPTPIRLRGGLSEMYDEALPEIRAAEVEVGRRGG